MTTEAEALYLFANYNNISTDIAQGFVEYVYSLLPGSGGVITGDLEITGNLTVDTDFTLDGVVNDNIGPTPSADFNLRQLFDSSGDPSVDYDLRELIDGGGISIFNWTTGIMLDATNKQIFDLFNRNGQDLTGADSFNWDSRQLITSTNKVVVDWENQKLYQSDGVTVAMDWSAGVSFVDLILSGNLTVGGFTYDTAGTPKKSMSANLRLLYDSTEVQSVDYQSRALKNGSGNSVFEWENGVGYNPAGLKRIDFANATLNAGAVTMCNWTIGALFYQSGLTCFDWGNGALYSNNGTTKQIDFYNNGYILMPNLPVAAGGLPAGALWNNAGVLSVV